MNLDLAGAWNLHDVGVGHDLLAAVPGRLVGALTAAGARPRRAR